VEASVFRLIQNFLESIKTHKKVSRGGRPTEYSGALIQVLATIKAYFKILYRMLEGFAKSIMGFFLKGVKLPTYSLICKRLAKLQIELPQFPRKGGVLSASCPLIGASDVKGEGFLDGSGMEFAKDSAMAPPSTNSDLAGCSIAGITDPTRPF